MVNPRDYDLDESSGLLCEGRDQKESIQVPLADVDVKKNDRNHTIVSDYAFWFANFG
jgi:hypothetical protein